MISPRKVKGELEQLISLKNYSPTTKIRISALLARENSAFNLVLNTNMIHLNSTFAEKKSQ